MSCCHYAIIPEKNLLFVKSPSGHLGNEDLIAKLRVYEDPMYREGMNEIHDYRDVISTDVFPVMIRQFVELVMAFEDRYRDGRIVFVRHPDFGQTFLERFREYYEEHPSGSTYRFEIFNTMGEALKSLGMDPEYPFDMPMKPLIL